MATAPPVMTVARFLADLAAHRATNSGQPFKLDGANFRRENLSTKDLHDVVFERCDFSGADLSAASLEGTSWRSCTLAAVKFSRANLLGAGFDDQCTFDRASFAGATGTRVKFNRNSLSNVDATGANFEEGDFGHTMLTDADFSRANLLKAGQFILDRTRVEQTEFSAATADPWSVLRRTYTGPRFTIHLVFLLAFALGLLAKAYAYQVAAYVSTSDALALTIEAYCEAHRCEKIRLIDVLLGTREGWAARLFIIVGLIYNVFRLLLTFAVSALRDQEERSARSPAYRPDHGLRGHRRLGSYVRAPLSYYGWMIWPHRIMLGLWLVMMSSFAIALWNLAHEVILVPVAAPS